MPASPCSQAPKAVWGGVDEAVALASILFVRRDTGQRYCVENSGKGSQTSASCQVLGGEDSLSRDMALCTKATS